MLVDLLGDDDFTPFVQASNPVVDVASSAMSFDPFAPPIAAASNTIWSSVQGQLDISLNNLIPHTRGDSPKTSVPLNQLIKSNK